MSRWHQSWCSQPVVFLSEEGGNDKRIPRCTNCQSQPTLAQMLDQQARNQKPWEPPDDEPVGERNYFWPPSVPYDAEKSDLADDNGPDVEQSPSAPTTESSNEKKGEEKEKASVDEAPAPPYKERLRGGQLRLICLHPVGRSSEGETLVPIHLELAAFDDDSCPEYEAVSYAWGGENGDSSRTHPIYIGDYWDAMLQTQNCYDMLRYLLPIAGVRWLWVDAVCIDQNSLGERSSQVSKMDAIFRNSLRVVLFLGRDATANRDQGPRTIPTIPPRRDLQSADSGTLTEMLSFRYFTRVWVIQELLLAPSIMIPFRGVHYRLNSGVPPEVYPLNWDQVNVPWFRFAARILYLPRLSLFEILQTTQFCQSTDPRDKIHGVLGIIRHQMTEGGGSDTCLNPNYSISPMHTFVGAFADMILYSKRIEMLLVAAGCNAPRGHPTWLPQMNKREIFSSVTSWTQPGKNANSDHDSIAIQTPWYRHPVSVGSKTCRLTLWPVRFLTIDDETIITMKDIDGDNLKQIIIGRFTFIVAGPSIDLPSLSRPGVTEVFLLGPPLMVLFLNRTLKGTHRLVAAFRCHQMDYDCSVNQRVGSTEFMGVDEAGRSGGAGYKPRRNQNSTYRVFPLVKSQHIEKWVFTVRVSSSFRNVEGYIPLYQSLEDCWPLLQSDLQRLIERMKSEQWQAGDKVGMLFPGVHWTSWKNVVGYWLSYKTEKDMQELRYISLMTQIAEKMRVKTERGSNRWGAKRTTILIGFSSREEEKRLLELYQKPYEEKRSPNTPLWPWEDVLTLSSSSLPSSPSSRTSSSPYMGAVRVRISTSDIHHILTQDIDYRRLIQNISVAQVRVTNGEEGSVDILSLLEKSLPDKYRFINAYPLPALAMDDSKGDLQIEAHRKNLETSRLELCRVSIE